MAWMAINAFAWRTWARDTRSQDFCHEKVAECDLFVGLIGLCYGSTPDSSDVSYTVQEYDAAVETQKPRLMFISTEEAYPGVYRQSDDIWQKQREFALESSRALRDSFENPDELAAKVTKAIRNWEQETSLITKPTYFEDRSLHFPSFDQSICREASLADLELDRLSEFLKTTNVLKQDDFKVGTELWIN